ncbi:MAG: hypothetical protein DHS20C21_15210 [Gemmatimonadota bacterium]|nr:MAG: hypothetical protein DHS20C21_15210 [Gemmatimonadota bacterium]
MTYERNHRPAVWLLLLAAVGCSRAPVPGPAGVPGIVDEPVVSTPALPAELWTVRIFTSADATEAEEFASQAGPRFDAPLTIVRSGGESHVQVGRFSSRESAEAFLAVAQERGYRLATATRLPGEVGDPTP